MQLGFAAGLMLSISLLDLAHNSECHWLLEGKSLGISLHNFPEGMTVFLGSMKGVAVALPVYFATQRSKMMRGAGTWGMSWILSKDIWQVSHVPKRADPFANWRYRFCRSKFKDASEDASTCMENGLPRCHLMQLMVIRVHYARCWNRRQVWSLWVWTKDRDSVNFYKANMLSHSEMYASRSSVASAQLVSYSGTVWSSFLIVACKLISCSFMTLLMYFANFPI